jgi:seryl-tRNA synthetase
MTDLVDQLEKMRSQFNGVAQSEASQRQASTPLTEQLDQMRIRMNEVAQRENQLVAELNASIRRMDNQLLHDVRSIAAEHESRRANILDELQLLSVRLNGFPYRERQGSRLGDAGRAPLSAGPSVQDQQLLEQDDQQRRIREALTYHLARQGQSH